MMAEKFTPSSEYIYAISFTSHLFDGTSLGWEGSIDRNHNIMFCCTICNDGIWRERKNCPRHEGTEKHLKAMAFQRANEELHHLRLQGDAGDVTDMPFIQAFANFVHALFVHWLDYMLLAW